MIFLQQHFLFVFEEAHGSCLELFTINISDLMI